MELLSDPIDTTASITAARIKKAVATSASSGQLTTFSEPAWVVRRLGSLRTCVGQEGYQSEANPYVLQWAFNVLKLVPLLPEPARIDPQADGGIQIEWAGRHSAALTLRFRPRHQLLIDLEQGEGARLRRNVTTNLSFLMQVSKWFAGNVAGKVTVPLVASGPREDGPQDAGTVVDHGAQLIRECAGRAGMTIDRDVKTRAGSRALTFICRRRFATLECDPDGDIVGTLSDRSADEEAETWLVDSTHIQESLTRIQRFLRGIG